MAVSELKEFIHSSYYNRMGFTKKDHCSLKRNIETHLIIFTIKLIKKY